MATVATVTLHETMPQAAHSVTLNTGAGGRVITLVRDSKGYLLPEQLF